MATYKSTLNRARLIKKAVNALGLKVQPCKLGDMEAVCYGTRDAEGFTPRFLTLYNDSVAAADWDKESVITCISQKDEYYQAETDPYALFCLQYGNVVQFKATLRGAKVNVLATWHPNGDKVDFRVVFAVFNPALVRKTDLKQYFKHA
jgi:hypothetical protein